MTSAPNLPPMPRAVASGLAVVIAVAAAAWSLLIALRDMVGVIRSPGRASVDEVVIAVSAAFALTLLLWVTVGLLAAVAAALPGPLGALSRRVRDAIAPEAVRRCAGVLLGVAVMSSCGPGGAVASDLRSGISLEPLATAPTPSSAAAPTWFETEPAPALAPAPEWTPVPVRSLPSVSLTAPRPSEDDDLAVTVRRGDTLWDLAAAHLAAEATDAEIAASWHRWYAANRDAIGPDPDLILPGQVLTVPAAADAAPAGGSR